MNFLFRKLLSLSLKAAAPDRNSRLFQCSIEQFLGAKYAIGRRAGSSERRIRRIRRNFLPLESHKSPRARGKDRSIYRLRSSANSCNAKLYVWEKTFEGVRAARADSCVEEPGRLVETRTRVAWGGSAASGFRTRRCRVLNDLTVRGT